MSIEVKRRSLDNSGRRPCANCESECQVNTIKKDIIAVQKAARGQLLSRARQVEFTGNAEE